MQANRKLQLLAGLTGILACAGWNPALAQRIPVVEAGSSQVQQQPAADNSGQSEIMVNMYLQLEALQTEIQALRGLVEEQSYQIRRMQTEQRDRYIDTDSRLSEINNQVRAYHGGQGTPVQLPTGNISPQAPTGGTPLPGATETPAIASQGTAAGATVALATPESEQDLYRQALNLLLEEEKIDESITLFQQYLDVYPRGRYLTNALYWQGAALELVGSYNRAIEVLQRLLTEHPDDAKAPTAMLRLGTVYREMGNLAQAAEHWRKISELYPNSTSEIEIANDYLNDISN